MPKFSLALILCAGGLWAAQPWTPEDIWNRHTLSDPRISPDGQRVVYVESWNDRGSNSEYANLWLASVRDREIRRITDGAWSDRSPRWSADGSRIAWISGRGGIHVLAIRDSMEGAIDVTTPLSLAWSADGKSIAFTARAEEKAALPAWIPAEILPLIAPLPKSSHVALYVVWASGGPAQPITAPGFDAAGEPAWMPDGKSILTAAADGQIYSVRLADHGAKALTQEGRNDNPLPSPNGSRIGWITTENQPHSYSIRKLYVMNADGTRVKELANGLDRDPVLPHWSPDSRTIYFLAGDAGATHIYASRYDSTLRQVTKNSERLRGFTVADNGHAATVRLSDRGEELTTFAVDLPPEPLVLAAPMEKLMSDRDTGAVEEVKFQSAGKEIQGWIVKPPQFEAAKKYPLLLDIADAPRAMYGAGFDLDSQIIAARGWLVLHINSRGTPGYGEHFGRLLPTRYPGDDADDLVAGLDFVCGKYSVDPKRVAIRGGLVAAWLMGHADRFSAAIVRRPIVDFTSYAAASDTNAQRVQAWMGVAPWDDPEQYVRHSPIYFAQNWKTPTLVIAEGPDPQSDLLYAQLQRRKIESVLMRVPDDKPATQVLRLQAELAWLERH